MNGKGNGGRFDFPDTAGVEVRCPACGRLLFVARRPWVEVPLAQAELLLICAARRGGWSCKAAVALGQKSEGRPT